MKSSIDYALEIAQYEAAAGNKVMILFPNRGWIGAALRRPEWSGSQTSDTNGIYLRASTDESSLKSLPIDTLVLVGYRDPSWNEKGEMYARERIRASRNPRVILAEDDDGRM